MEHRSKRDITEIARILPDPICPVLTRAERLERWATLLEAEPRRVLSPLWEYEHKPKEVRREYRVDNSPFSVAFADATLRSAGLASDKAGDVMDFFELDENQLHHAFCYCHVADSLTGERAARSVWAFMKPKLGVLSGWWRMAY
jgi:hypothetical protein